MHNFYLKRVKTRQRFLGLFPTIPLLLVMAALGTALAAPQNNLAPAAFGVKAEPPSKIGKYGGRFIEPSYGEPSTFNLWVSADASSSNAASFLYSSLNELNPYTLKWQGSLANSPQVSKDGLIWTFRLKDGVRWSDGVPITADDVIFTLKVIYDEAVRTNIREGMTLEVPDGKGGLRRAPIGYKKLNPQTVQFRFPFPHANADSLLNFPIAPRHKLEPYWKKRTRSPLGTAFNQAWGVDMDLKELVTSGPWVMTEYVPGERLVYGRNPHYWKKTKTGKPLPYLDQYIQKFAPDLANGTIDFEENLTDLMVVRNNDYYHFRDNASKGNYKVWNLGPTFSTNFVSFNMNMKSKAAKKNPQLIKLFNDTRFRQIVSHAINRKKIVQQYYYGLAMPGYGPESPANKLYYSPNIPQFDYDLGLAKKKLAAMGLRDTNRDGILEFSDGRPVRFSLLTNQENPTRVAIARMIGGDLRKLGIAASYEPVPFTELITRLDGKPEPGNEALASDWQAVMMGFTGGIEPNDGKNIWMSTGNLHQWEPYQQKPQRAWEAKIDDLFRRGAREMNPVKRKSIYAEFQKVVAQEQPLIYIVVPYSVVALRNKFGNIKPCTVGGVTWNLEEIYDLKATRNRP